MSSSHSNLTQRLPLPDGVQRGRVLWYYALPIAFVHILGLAAALPWLFSWTGVVLAIVGVFVFGQGINLCYHRLLTHRSFEVPRWLEHLFVIVALCCMQDTPIRWVVTHRLHHNSSDEPPDPHSPLVSFFWSHMGWLLVPNRHINLGTYQKYAPDLLSDSFYLRLEKNHLLALYVYLAHAAIYFVGGIAVALLTGGGQSEAIRLGLSFVVWGVIVRTILVWHITWSVNSLTHLFGYRTYETGENSRNNWLVGILAVGEGWHNNHHHDPASACTQHRWWEIDVTYYVIRLLELVGLAKRVVAPRHERQASRTGTHNP